MAGPVEFVHILKRFREYRFRPVPEAEMLAALKSGEYDALLVFDPSDAFHRYRLPLEHDQSLLVENAKEKVVANLANFGAHIELTEDRPVLRLQESGLIRRLGPDLVQIFLPTAGPVERAGPLVVEVVFPVQAPSRGALSLVCAGAPVGITVGGRQFSAELPAAVIDASLPTQLCRLHIRDLQFGARILSSSIELRAYAGAP